MIKEYMGFKAHIELDEVNNVYFGRVIDVEDIIITFESPTKNDIDKAFHEAIDDYLDWI